MPPNDWVKRKRGATIAPRTTAVVHASIDRLTVRPFGRRTQDQNGKISQSGEHSAQHHKPIAVRRVRTESSFPTRIACYCHRSLAAEINAVVFIAQIDADVAEFIDPAAPTTIAAANDRPAIFHR